MTTDFDELEREGIPRDLVRQILENGVSEILFRDSLSAEGLYLKSLKMIFLRRLSVEEEKEAAQLISQKEGIDLSSGEIYVHTILHEWGHHRGLKHEECNRFASRELCKMRGYSRKFILSLNLDIEDMAKKAIVQALKQQVP